MSDYIKREDAVKALRTIKNCVKLFEESIEDCAVTLNDLASAADVVERKRGKWLLQDGYRCSVCLFKLQTTGIPTYCPNCGSYMRGES